ncbi:MULTISPECIES: hypothetical protein, partial [unclassified Microcoleus]|uniref:hypothetical protein n=1 Tax=unclassified Microcoleus TaxID=2642155 RepID=UPI002FCEA17C
FRYLGTIVLTAENNCLCGQALASQCDGRTVILRIYPDRIVRVPCWRTLMGCGGRSPPGGDAIL